MTYLSHQSAALYWNIPYLPSLIPQFYMPGPTHYTVFSRTALRAKKGTIVHLCSVSLPEASIYYDFHVVTPELLFLQLCSIATDVLEAIIIGCALCSPHKIGKAPLTTVKKLTKYARKAKYMWGRPRALRALRYIRENFLSEIEILQYIITKLPNHLGGCAYRGIYR